MASAPRESIPDASEEAKAPVASAPRESIPDASEEEKAPVTRAPREPIPDASEAAKARGESALRESIPDPSEAAKARGESAPREFIPDASEARAEPIPNKSVAAECMITQVFDHHVPNPHALNPNATAITPSVCKKFESNSCNNPLSSDTKYVTASG